MSNGSDFFLTLVPLKIFLKIISFSGCWRYATCQIKIANFQSSNSNKLKLLFPFVSTRLSVEIFAIGFWYSESYNEFSKIFRSLALQAMNFGSDFPFSGCSTPRTKP